ncbi:hypothetical protein WOLCODRAFT_23744 [Wolfiporia cocos MD-104 SS10]|uniref:Uncharacterized protein n=1 Tax=Wolfiporia cocos (strain MD-104) TaxID=742152 RepID=A0A2H3JCH5_WOLCO|nr:hypothetical protein WOLCODRAFT_23744 [Wolfiporia cocos MD-104 SS10]
MPPFGLSRLRPNSGANLKSSPSIQISASTLDDDVTQRSISESPASSVISFMSDFSTEAGTIQKLEQKLAEEQVKVSEKDDEISELKVKLAHALETADMLQEGQKELDSSYERARQERDEAHQTISDLNSLIEGLRARCDAAEAECNALADDIKAKSEELEAERATLQEAAALAAARLTKLDELEERANGLQTDNDNKVTQIRQLEGEAAEAVDKQARLEAGCDEALKRIAALEEEVAMEKSARADAEASRDGELAARLESEAQSAAQARELEGLKDQVDGLQSDNGDKKVRIQQLEKEVASASEELAQMEYERTEALNSLSKLQEELAHEKEARQSMEREMEYMQKALLNAEEHAAARTHERDNTLDDLVALQEECDEKGARITQLEQEGVQASERQAQLEADRDESRSLLAHLEEKLAGEVDERQRGGAELENERTARSESVAQLQELSAHVERLQAENDEKSARILELEGELTAKCTQKELDLDEAHTQVSRLKEELATEKSARESAKTSLEKEHASRLQADEQIAGQARQVEDLVSQVASLTAEREALRKAEDEVDKLHAEVDNLTDQCIALMAERDESQKHASKLEYELGCERSMRQSTEEFLEAEHAARLDAECEEEASRPIIRELRLAQDRITEELERKNAELQEIVAREQALRRTIVEQDAECVQHMTRIHELEERAAEEAMQRERDRSDGDAAANRARDLEERLAQATASLERAVEECSSKDEDFKAIHDSLVLHMDELEDAQAEVREQKRIVRALEEQLRDAFDGTKRKEDELQISQETIELIMDELNTARREAQESRGAAQTLQAQLEEAVRRQSHRGYGSTVGLDMNMENARWSSSHFHDHGDDDSPHIEVYDTSVHDHHLHEDHDHSHGQRGDQDCHVQ